LDVETRSPERIRAHYEVERGLARQLREAPKDSRQTLYSSLYDELFRRVPDHPQLRRKETHALSEREVRRKMALVGRYLKDSTRFLEVGPGDCAFAFAAAMRVNEVIAVDVSAQISAHAVTPPNFQLVISNGTSIPVRDASISVAYSNQLMEHLHPDDAEDQLRNLYRALEPGGTYICITPNRVSGPHDVSSFFDRAATGFHLREYTYKELFALFRTIGFRRFRGYIGGQGIYIRCPLRVLMLGEAILSRLPWTVRKALSRSIPGRALLGINLVAVK
jgi:ubiquinone/menaquinone biosynthesis C-methylase UbiE